jgi:sulfite reductase beta subunit-like hemoprotein
VDVFSQDLGLVMLKDGDGKLKGYNFLIGGGLGSSHNKAHTYPRAASPVAYVNAGDVMEAIEAVVTIQRDYGDRTDRAQARLKYLVDRVGIEWFHEEMERRMGKKLDPAVEITNWGYDDHIGWHEQKDGLLYVGVFVENGRIDGEQKARLRRIVETYRPQVRLTPQQNLVLSHIKPEHKDAIQEILTQAHISSGNGWLSVLRRNQMSCVALPTCGLALAEAERISPNMIEELEKLGYGNERISIRVSGCPNACSRAPMAEIGLLGRGPGKYNLYLGGDYLGTRTNQLYKETMRYEDIVPEIARLIDRWRAERNEGEAFGDYCLRVGLDNLKE